MGSETMGQRILKNVSLPYKQPKIVGRRESSMGLICPWFLSVYSVLFTCTGFPFFFATLKVSIDLKVFFNFHFFHLDSYSSLSPQTSNDLSLL